nr:reverse transcriptase domain-containing protein [Tanacetum cinerariifolium]
MFKQLHINITLADALILIPKYQKMLKTLFYNKEKLLELENIPLNENCLAIILKKLLEKLGDPGKFLIRVASDSIDQSNLADLNDNLVDTMPEMFTYEHTLDYSSPPLYNEYHDDLFEVGFNTEYVYDDPFNSKGEKIKESKLLINELDLARSSDFPSFSEYDSFLSKDFSKVDALPSTNNEDKVFNPGILIQEKLFEVIPHVAPDKNVKKLAISHASLMFEDFDPPLYELPFFKEVPGAKILLSFSFKIEEKFSNLGF